MPIYDFRCPDCGHKFNELCAMGETGDKVACPACGRVGVERKVSLAAAPVVAGGGGGAPVGGGCGCGAGG